MIPSRSGTFTAYPFPRFIPTSCRSAGTLWRYNGNQGCKAYSDIASTRKEFSKPMKTRRHHSISRVESFLHAISMVHVNIDVKHSGMYATKSATPAAIVARQGDRLSRLTVIVPEYRVRYPVSICHRTRRYKPEGSGPLTCR